jgi:KaiC/GvpD/RAD55 family RecA-like ATPase
MKSYVSDLDVVLNGGIPQNSIVLLAGSAGTGKTTLAMQFLFGGAVNENDTSLLLTFNEQEMKLVSNFKQFSFFNQSLVDQSKVVIADVRTALPNNNDKNHSFSSEEALAFIYEQLDKYKPKRIVIDSISAICKRFDDESHVRKFLFDLGNLLIFKNCTALLISEVEPGQRKYSNFGVEEFLADGIIYLSHLDKNNRLKKTLQVVKMRGCKHSEDQFMLNIDESGIKLMKLMEG